MSHTIHLSDGSQYAAQLVVYRDFLESRGAWRLFWQDPGTTHGVQEQSTVMGQPFFRTRAAAVAYAVRRYGLTPERGRGFCGDLD